MNVPRSRYPVENPFFPSPWRSRLAASATVAGWILLAGVVASWYLGSSPSPYGVCYAASGRAVPCALVKR